MRLPNVIATFSADVTRTSENGMYLIVVERVFFFVLVELKLDVFVQIPRLLIAEDGSVDAGRFEFVLSEIEVVRRQRCCQRNGQFLHVVREVIQFHTFPKDSLEFVIFGDFDETIISDLVHGIPFLVGEDKQRDSMSFNQSNFQ